MQNVPQGKLYKGTKSFARFGMKTNRIAGFINEDCKLEQVTSPLCDPLQTHYHDPAANIHKAKYFASVG